VPAEEVSQRVPMDVHKNKDSDKVSNEGSDEDWDGDEVFPENTAKGKNKKRERTEADKVSNEGSDEELEEATPVKKKAKKSPSKAPTKKNCKICQKQKDWWESQPERRTYEVRQN